MSKRIKPTRPAKSPHIEYPIISKTPPMAKCPIFSFLYLQDRYCITKCSKEEKIGFVDAMRKLSKLTWNQIRSSDRHTLGTEKINRGQIKVQVPSSISEDNSFFAIRFHQLKPMVGFREDNIFHIVWFDRDYSLYDHGN